MNSVTLQGIRNNRQQFWLLVLVTAFIGSMVGMERSLLPQLALQVFHIASKKALFSFIVAFGISKACANYFTGRNSVRLGRKRLLTIGWLFALPVPWILMYAPAWQWIVAGNILLGINQGITWSSTVLMKLDIAGPRERGFAMGLNEFAGYSAVAIVTFLAPWIASKYGLRPYPFYTGVFFSAAGLIFSLFGFRDIAATSAATADDSRHEKPSARGSGLGIIIQGGTVNNLNDGMLWGLFPLLLAARDYPLAQVGAITAVYPACWGIGQLFTGRLGDVLPKKTLIASGLALQAAALLSLPFAYERIHFVALSIALGLGKALVYPNFAAAIAERTGPQARSRSIGLFRFFRDFGYAFGAALTGIVADAFGTRPAILLVAAITALSALITAVSLKPAPRPLPDAALS
jgi:MFS family permease